MSKPIETLRPALFLFSWCYGLVVFVRNSLYDWGVFKSKQFKIPIICIGNITVGGTAKTPHAEYLIRKYRNHYNLAVLSRGYGRKSKGFRYVGAVDSADLVGDEPLQMKQKFPDVTFAVDEKRVRGIQKLQNEGYELIILDDAFQHRAVSSSKAIVLLDYNRLPHQDYYLPSGNLREGRYALRRSDCVLVTKCPKHLDEKKEQQIIRRNKVKKPVFFTHFEYGELHRFDDQKTLKSLKDISVFLVTGIANPEPLICYLKANGAKVTSLAYPDHYDFQEKDLDKIAVQFTKLHAKNKIILTTEKDKVKLQPLLGNHKKIADCFHYIAVEVAFENENKSSEFLQLLAL